MGLLVLVQNLVLHENIPDLHVSEEYVPRYLPLLRTAA